jgi:predicted RNA-binding protein YlqC (UPF0109 family)
MDDARLRMPTVEQFRRVVAAIEALVGPDAFVDDIAIEPRETPAETLRVRLRTPEPGRFIGRRGANADALRARLTNDLGTEVQLDIAESPPHAPPLEPPSGVRVPRRPRPGGPPANASLLPPVDPSSDQTDAPAAGTRTPPTPPGDRRGAA